MIANKFSLVLLAGLLSCNLSFAAKPNIVLVITDDQGYGDIGAHGNTMINPLFPALRSGPTTAPGASLQKQIPSSHESKQQ
jgi:hypothetical protein